MHKTCINKLGADIRLGVPEEIPARVQHRVELAVEINACLLIFVYIYLGIAFLGYRFENIRRNIVRHLGGGGIDGSEFMFSDSVEKRVLSGGQRTYVVAVHIMEGDSAVTDLDNGNEFGSLGVFERLSGASGRRYQVAAGGEGGVSPSAERRIPAGAANCRKLALFVHQGAFGFIYRKK